MALVPIEEYKSEIEIKKSKFIGIGSPVFSPEDARSKIKNIKEEYPDSRHVCYGFVWGKNSSHMGMSDDGEPSGTAGRPILEVVKGSGYENILVAVVRYFGGIKLGTGGLVKAYTEITKSVTSGIIVKELIERTKAELLIPYGLYDNCKKAVQEYNCEILEEEFLVDIKIVVDIPDKYIGKFEAKIIDISKGNINLTRL